MNAPDQTTARPAPTNRIGPRIAASVILGVIAFFALWLMAFNLIASLLISSGCCVILIATSTVSDVIQTVLDAIASVISVILAAIGAVFAVIFGLFGW
jgi:hypothetical protein